MSSYPNTVVLPWVVRRTGLPALSLKLTVHERTPVTSFDPAELDGYHANDPDLVASKLLDPLLARRNRFSLDWNGAWRLDTPSAWLDQTGPVQVEIVFADPVSERLIAHGLGLSRNEALRRARRDSPLRRPTSAGFRLDFRRARRFSGGRLRWGRRR